MDSWRLFHSSESSCCRYCSRRIMILNSFCKNEDLIEMFQNCLLKYLLAVLNCLLHIHRQSHLLIKIMKNPYLLSYQLFKQEILFKYFMGNIHYFLQFLLVFNLEFSYDFVIESAIKIILFSLNLINL